MGLDVRTTYKNTFRNFSEPGYQICMYDRAGYGKSSPLSSPRPLKALSDELDGPIRARQWQDVVVVAHSFGGLVGRYYATTHPGTVKGLVLVDAVHESWYGGLQKALSPDGWRIMQMIIGWERDKNSHEDFAEGSTTMAAAVALLAMPVTVLSRGLPLTNIRQAKMSYDDVDAFNDSWDVAQLELARATGGRHVRMRYASHQFDEQDPWIVLEEISLLLTRVAPSPPR